jgi:hypothetical protein
METWSGLIAERKLIPHDMREGSSVDETMLAQTCCNWIAAKLFGQIELAQKIGLAVQITIGECLDMWERECLALAALLESRLALTETDIAPHIAPILGAAAGNEDWAELAISALCVGSSTACASPRARGRRHVPRRLSDAASDAGDRAKGYPHGQAQGQGGRRGLPRLPRQFFIAHRPSDGATPLTAQ